MEIISIDRTASNHGKYVGTVKLTYDEIVLPSGALYYATQSQENSRKDKCEKLHRSWRGFEYVACHGDASGRFA